MNTQDKLIDVKDLSLVTSAVMTNIYDIQNDSEAMRNDISGLNYNVHDLYEQIENLPSPMVFKGSLGTGGTITSLPTASTDNEGYTYKVITAGTYASQAAKIGDMFISDGSNWIYIPSADEPSGTVTSITLKATSPIAIDSSSAITTSGTRTLSHANSGVTAGTYRSVTVNATGHVTAGTNPTTLSGYGITDAKIANGVITLGSNTITPLTSHQSIKTINNNTITGTGNVSVGTITGITMNGASKGTSGVVDLGTVATSDTKNTAGSTNSTNKLFLVGATSQAANPQTYSHSSIYSIGTGYLHADGYLFGDAAIEYNSTDKCIEFNIIEDE